MENGEVSCSDALTALLDPLQRLCPSLEIAQALVAHLEGDVEGEPSEEHARLLRQRIVDALLRAASSGDLKLLAWLCQRVIGPTSSKTKFTWDDLRDDEGAGPMTLAASSGHAEAVRLLVSYGANVNERDAAGWTPLMWAVNCSNVPLTSYLLSHGADANAQTNKGATCEDFILSADPTLTSGTSLLMTRTNRTPRASTSSIDSRAGDRSLIADLIYEHQQQVEEEAEAPFPASYGSGEAASESGWSSQHSSAASATPRRRLIGHTERTQKAEIELTSREVAEGRKRNLLDIAHVLGVSYDDLLGEAQESSPRAGRRSATSSPQAARRRHSLDAGCGAHDVGSDALSTSFDFDVVQADQMLVFGESQIESLIDHLVRRARPVRAPWIARARPANVTFLCMRYACFLGDRDLLEDLLTAFVEAVEAAIYAHPTQLTHLAFWLYNGVLLLHYTLRDTPLSQFDADKEYANILAELINEVYMFLIRDTERRIDKMLDAAILEHEAFEGLEDIRYEDEWTLLRTLKGSVKGFGSASNSPHTSPLKSMTPNRRKPLDQIFANAASSPTKATTSPSLGSRLGATLGPVTPTRAHLDSSIDDLMAKPSPRSLTTLLTSVLRILQLYEVNPAIIVQALSQVFFWIGCELFNRILTQRRFLCKARVMHIRLNLSALEDWVKTNALPAGIVKTHFASVHQLVSWVLCQSSLSDFDGLISTMQELKLLNPAQLRRVVRDYRYEANEARMSEEGLQYLEQMQRDWERNLVQEETRRREQVRLASVKAEEARNDQVKEDRTEALTENSADDTAAAARPHEAKPGPDSEDDAIARLAQDSIDALFPSSRSVFDYVPPSLPPAYTNADREQLNSRDMLPFALPTSAADLVVSPGDAFGFGRGHFMGTGTPSLKDARPSSLIGQSLSVPRFPNTTKSRSSSRASSPTKASRSVQSANSPIWANDLHAALSGVTSETSTLASTTPDGKGLQPSLMPPSSAADAASISSRGADSTTSTGSRLFAQGKGLAAGASWQPVPLLADGTLEILAHVMRVPSGFTSTTPRHPLS